MHNRTRIAALLVVALFALGASITQSLAHRSAPAPQGTGEGLTYVKNIPYSFGTDMELATIDGRDYAFAGSAAPLAQGGGLHVIDVTDPAKAREVAWLKCSVYQADIQISHDQNTVIMAADDTGTQESCEMATKLGFLTIDISDPTDPKVIGMADIPLGSHNITAHPTKPYVYNSDSELTAPGEIQIWSIANPARPELVNSVLSAPHSPHDISFNEDGTMAVTAAVSHFDIFDTTDPENPVLTFTDQCPGCSITHDAKFTPDGSHIFIGDEAGGGAPFPCPGGALYAYEITGNPVTPVPVLVGTYEPVVVATAQGGVGPCTSHVFEISPDSKRLVISWYTAGTRLLDISDPAAMTELGWFIPEGGESWSSKFHPRMDKTWVFSNDVNLGFDVYKIGEGGGGGGGGGTGGGPLPGPRVRLAVADRTPDYGHAVGFKVRLRKCAGHAGTSVRLERRIGDGGKFESVGKKKLNENCLAKFRDAARYEKATYRGVWPKQDEDHRAGRSPAKTVTTN